MSYVLAGHHIHYMQTDRKMTKRNKFACYVFEVLAKTDDRGGPSRCEPLCGPPSRRNSMAPRRSILTLIRPVEVTYSESLGKWSTCSWWELFLYEIIESTFLSITYLNSFYLFSFYPLFCFFFMLPLKFLWIVNTEAIDICLVNIINHDVDDTFCNN